MLINCSIFSADVASFFRHYMGYRSYSVIKSVTHSVTLLLRQIFGYNFYLKFLVPIYKNFDFSFGHCKAMKLIGMKYKI